MCIVRLVVRGEGSVGKIRGDGKVIKDIGSLHAAAVHTQQTLFGRRSRNGGITV
jgi:hypothetical protein